MKATHGYDHHTERVTTKVRAVGVDYTNLRDKNKELKRQKADAERREAQTLRLAEDEVGNTPRKGKYSPEAQVGKLKSIVQEANEKERETQKRAEEYRDQMIKDRRKRENEIRELKAAVSGINYCCGKNPTSCDRLLD
jgi:hypothetical protein